MRSSSTRHLPSAVLAASATGTIIGRVQNVATGQYLNKARVTLKGITQVVYPDNFGRYQFVGVPAGSVTIDIFYTDLDPVSFNVTVLPDGFVD